MSEVYLILHGTGGNTPDHWQEHLAESLRLAGMDVRYPKLPNAEAPRLAPWMQELQATMNTIPNDADVTVLAHSRGCILWMHYAAQHLQERLGSKAARVLLVAPPYVTADDLEAQCAFMPGAEDFFPVPLDSRGIQAASNETFIIASDDDEYATFEQSTEYAKALQTPIYKLSNSGHISPFYGYGQWPWVTDWSLHHAELPPLPNK